MILELRLQYVCVEPADLFHPGASEISRKSKRRVGRKPRERRNGRKREKDNVESLNEEEAVEEEEEELLEEEDECEVDEEDVDEEGAFDATCDDQDEFLKLLKQNQAFRLDLLPGWVRCHFSPLSSAFPKKSLRVISHLYAGNSAMLTRGKRKRALEGRK